MIRSYWFPDTVCQVQNGRDRRKKERKRGRKRRESIHNAILLSFSKRPKCPHNSALEPDVRDLSEKSLQASLWLLSSLDLFSKRILKCFPKLGS